MHRRSTYQRPPAWRQAWLFWLRATGLFAATMTASIIASQQRQ